MSRAWSVPLALLAVVGCSDDDADNGPTGTTTPPPPVTLIAADRNGDLYTVDPDTGTEELLLDTVPTAFGGTEIGVVSAMLWVPETELLWLGMGGNADCSGCILTVDVETGVTTVLEDTGERAVPGLAMRPADGQIFMPEGDSEAFFSVDTETGEVEEIATGITDSSGKGITFTLGGECIVAADESLYEVILAGTITDRLIGEMVLLGLPDFAGGYSIGSLTTRPQDGVIFGILKDDGGSGGSGPTYLVTVNPDTGVVTNVGVNGVKLDGLAFVPEELFAKVARDRVTDASPRTIPAP